MARSTAGARRPAGRCQNGRVENRPAPVQALIIVDAQRAFVSGADAVPASGTFVPALDELLQRARMARALVVHLQNDGPIGELDEPHQDGWELFYPVQESDREVVIRKIEDDGFDGTSLGDLLADHKIERVVIGGVMSEMCARNGTGRARARVRGGHAPQRSRDLHDQGSSRHQRRSTSSHGRACRRMGTGERSRDRPAHDGRHLPQPCLTVLITDSLVLSRLTSSSAT